MSSNPNLIHHGPPPPLTNGGGPRPRPPSPHNQQTTTVETTHTQPPIYSPPIPLGIAPQFAPGIGIGALPFPSLMSMPFGGPTVMDPALFGMAHGVQGALAPIRTGNFLPGAHHGIGFGLHAAGGVPIPPPPPGSVLAGGMMPFAGMSGGLAFGNVPNTGMGVVGMGGVPMMGMGGVGLGMGMGMGMGMMGMGFGPGTSGPMHTRPAPMMHDANAGFPAQPPQEEITQLAGGIPPGVTHVEPAEVSIFFVISGPICPWLPANFGSALQLEAMSVSSSTGLNRLIQICNDGLKEGELENMAITECIELGNGMWEKGQTFKYNDAVSRVLTMKDAGWDNKRNRVGGASLHLWGHQI